MIAPVIYSLRDLGFGIYHKIPYEVGECVFNRSWDILVILDACRVDAIRSFRSEYNWLSGVDTIYSVGSNSIQWMNRTFRNAPSIDKYEISYITANPYSSEYVSENDIAHMDEVWRYAWDEDKGTVPARPVTDRAITIGRSRDEFDRIIVHYMQPHFPSVPAPLGSGKSAEDWGKNRMEVWDNIKEGNLAKSTAWESYLDNLQYVLDDVDLLLNNLDAEHIVITSDHGEAFGEWGLYGHGYEPAPILRRVPWVITTGEDTNQYTPDNYNESKDVTTIEDRLKHLGYR